MSSPISKDQHVGATFRHCVGWISSDLTSDLPERCRVQKRVAFDMLTGNWQKMLANTHGVAILARVCWKWETCVDFTYQNLMELGAGCVKPKKEATLQILGGWV